MIKTKSKFASEIKRFGLVFIPINWGICLIVTLILYFAIKGDNSYALGYLLGSITSYLTFGLHMKGANDYGSDKANLVMKIFTNYGTRFIITGVVLLIAYLNDNIFRFLTCAIGICVIKAFLIIFALIFFRKENKREERSIDTNNDTDRVS